jgi:hypothetical protein
MGINSEEGEVLLRRDRHQHGKRADILDEGGEHGDGAGERHHLLRRGGHITAKLPHHALDHARFGHGGADE